ncbi:MAG: pseudouridine synthase [Candidatus Omnitrophota bacterium]
MRLQVFLSHSGACSRRKALDLILQGRVTVSGKAILEPSYPITDVSGVVALDGKRIILPEEKIYILLNKPKGVTTTKSDRFAEKKILDVLPIKFKDLYPVGRLDKDTTGLILLTNDGILTHRMSHPSFEVDKAYKVVLDKPLKLQDKYKIEKGVLLDDKVTSPCRVLVTGEEVEIVIHEGRKRQVRRMFALLRYHVRELVRTRQGPLSLGELKEGQWRFLTKDEVEQLRSI